MTALFSLIKKNFKVLIRSKSSALIIILGPLLIIFLVGVAFDNINKFSLNIGTYSPEYSELTNSFIEKLNQEEYNVEKVDSEENCVERIKRGTLHTCIIFPANMVLEPQKKNDIIFYVDHSKINLIYSVLDSLSTNIESRSSELSLDLTSNLLDKIEDTKTRLDAEKPTVINLKTENQQISEKIETFRANINEFSDTSAALRTYFLEKISVTQSVITVTQNRVDSSNASTTEKKNINQKLAEINTHLLNMQTKINDPNSQQKTDWTEITRLTQEITTQINGLQDLVKGTIPKVDTIKSLIEELYTNLDSIGIKEAAAIVSPVNTQIRPVLPEKTYLNYLFPSLIVLVIMFISILLSTTLVQMEKHSPAYFRNFITPTRSITFIAATYITTILIVALQLLIILFISGRFFTAQVLPNIQIFVPILLLITTLFTLLGMAIGYVFESEETATLASISLGSIFLFLSNVILPLESMPLSIRNIAQYNPFVLAEGMLRKTFLFQASFDILKIEMLYLAGASLILFLFIWFFYKSTRKHYFHNIFSHKKKKHKK